MDFNEALRIMKLNRQFYDLLADEFSATRSLIWEEFKFLGEYFDDEEKVLDLGCGNGRFFELLAQSGKKIQYFGADNSPKLIALAKDKYPSGQFILTDGLKIPFSENFFDKVLCAAALRHLPSFELRREFLREAFRVLKPGGTLVLTVQFLKSRWKYWGLLLKYSWLKISGRSKLDWGDVYERWGGKGVRFLHQFNRQELKNLLEEVGFKIKNLAFLKRQNGEKNLLAVAEK